MSASALGYAVLGISIGLYVGLPGSAEGGVSHLLTHGLMIGAAFLSAGALIYGLRRDRPDAALTLADLAGAARRYPVVALALSLAVLGLGGLPSLQAGRGGAGRCSRNAFAAGFHPLAGVRTGRWPECLDA